MKNLKILVPTDFSDESKFAYNLAKEIINVRKIKGLIYLINFVKSPIPWSIIVTGDASLLSSDTQNIGTIELIKRNTQMLDDLTQGDQLSVHKEVIDDYFDSGIQNLIQEKDIDLLIMGTTGETNLSELFKGSHAEQAITTASIPVITLQRETRLKDLKNIILGVDIDSKSIDPKAVTYITNLRDILDANLYLVHVYSGDRNETELMVGLKAFAHKHHLPIGTMHVVKATNPLEGLVEFSKKLESGLIAVLSKAEGGFYRLFENSQAVKISQESKKPVLVVNEGNV